MRMDHVDGVLPIPYNFSFFFFSFFEFYIGEEGMKSMMDHLERRDRMFVALILYWCLHMIMQHVLGMQALVLNGESWENAVILSICFESMKTSDHSM